MGHARGKRGDSSLATVFEDYETVAPDQILPARNVDTDEQSDYAPLTLSFVLHRSSTNQTIDVWQTKIGASLCRSPIGCYRFPAGTPPRFVLFPMLETWTFTEGDVDQAIQRLRDA
jgi:hypothetical protein